MTTDKDFYGLLAEFEDPTSLYRAAERVRDAGYKKWDCHTPFPVHGLDDAMGMRFTRLPWVILTMGVTGLLLGMLMQWWMNGVDYTYDISGKPVWSLPANIPVIFEVTVLFSAFTAFFAMWISNGLPRWYHPLFRKERFARATDDGFFLAIEARDSNFALDRTGDFLKSIGALSVEEVREADEPVAMPRSLKGKLWIASCLALIPAGMVYASYGKTTTQPRVHLIKDMDKQPRFHAQGYAPTLFEDGRMTRSQIPGTVAQDQGFALASFETGKSKGDYLQQLPSELNVDEAFLNRGEERFAIYCAVCHGKDGKGAGPVHKRAKMLAGQGLANWVTPTDLTSGLIAGQADGMVFETITQGRRTMPSYAAQIPTKDRWAIIAYIRALQEEASAGGPSAQDLAAMSPVERGKMLFTSKTCNACHTLTGMRLVGPPLNGLFGREEEMEGGEKITVDESYFKESLLDPNAKVVKTFPPAMTSFAGQITDEEIQDLIAFLKTQK